MLIFLLKNESFCTVRVKNSLVLDKNVSLFFFFFFFANVTSRSKLRCLAIVVFMIIILIVSTKLSVSTVITIHTCISVSGLKQELSIWARLFKTNDVVS